MAAVQLASKTSEWYTPPWMISSVLEVMREIDLDPCANSHIDPTVPARLHYTQEDDGLTHAWAGRVYMNPPYGDGVLAWMSKLAHEYRAGDVCEAVTLWKPATDTRAWRTITEVSDLLCTVSTRLHFSGCKDPAPFPSVVFYAGSHPDLFRAVFSRHGQIWDCPRPADRQQSISEVI